MIKRKPSRKVCWEKSYAKVNLFLQVLGKREDNYHEIRTIFHLIDLHDELSFSPDSAISVNMELNDSLKDLMLPELKENTVYMVASKMKSMFEIEEGVKINITKNIPIAAGLGGGSSNAAVAIKALSHLWGLQLKPEQMAEIASDIGSDVSYFLYGGTALGEGRGEVIKGLDPVYFDKILLVKPGFGIASSEAYALFATSSASAGADNTHCDKNMFVNDLEAPVRRKYPEIDSLIEEMAEKGASKSILSGSGSTVIGIYDDERLYNDSYRYFRGKGYWAYQTKTYVRTGHRACPLPAINAFFT